ncbi:hypothetical protein EMIHUDRAFT_225473 [Emiliania huxleyi CCMP1516]|uniref:Uncharacterized protein n=2 Tax=Emiliania huxleyi TaxID=2903 RepID=A0A0D3KNK4_EMIH1|nr:hypothetical protein EMIHUDRAFT_225473 [Emiliania huxleyi CCMP1516]EOD37339.1 hypothetical protein EMIHUDRAFT_225473 [Emiliania huxleyi CCMP1516]|eukprot:XP_005789768.1 hypothetical protein EMIHUDRAFT_225473 [Emiliania huxleyi CCMP1516]
MGCMVLIVNGVQDRPNTGYSPTHAPAIAPGEHARVTRYVSTTSRESGIRGRNDVLLLHLAAAPSVLAVYATAAAYGIALVQLGDAGCCCGSSSSLLLPDSVKPAAQRGVQNSRGFVPPEAERIRAHRPELDGTTRLTETRGTGHGGTAEREALSAARGRVTAAGKSRSLPSDLEKHRDLNARNATATAECVFIVGAFGASPMRRTAAPPSLALTSS